MRGRQASSAPDYTNACLIMGYINLLWVLIALSVVVSFPTALVLCALVHVAISRLALQKR